MGHRDQCHRIWQTVIYGHKRSFSSWVTVLNKSYKTLWCYNELELHSDPDRNHNQGMFNILRSGKNQQLFFFFFFPLIVLTVIIKKNWQTVCNALWLIKYGKWDLLSLGGGMRSPYTFWLYIEGLKITCFVCFVSSDHQNIRISSLSPQGRTTFKELTRHGAPEKGTDNLRT